MTTDLSLAVGDREGKGKAAPSWSSVKVHPFSAAKSLRNQEQQRVFLATAQGEVVEWGHKSSITVCLAVCLPYQYRRWPSTSYLILESKCSDCASQWAHSAHNRLMNGRCCCSIRQQGWANWKAFLSLFWHTISTSKVLSQGDTLTLTFAAHDQVTSSVRDARTFGCTKRKSGACRSCSEEGKKCNRKLNYHICAYDGKSRLKMPSLYAKCSKLN